jgi:hypothetical protein
MIFKSKYGVQIITYTTSSKISVYDLAYTISLLSSTMPVFDNLQRSIYSDNLTTHGYVSLEKTSVFKKDRRC